MARPDHFFKYVSAERAKQIIRDRTLRWSAPVRFNDPFDLQFDMHVEYDRNQLIEDATAETWAFYSGEKEFVPANPLGHLIKEISALPQRLSKADFVETMRGGIAESLAAQEENLPKVQAGLREQLSPVRVLCLSETPSNILMWSHYALNHTGAVLRLSCIEALDSPWGAAQPVQYRKDMPLLFDHAGLFSFLTGQSVIDKTRILDESVTVKAIDWEYEKEWRVVYHGDAPLEYDDAPFNISQLTGIYFGCKTSDNDWGEISELAQHANPDIEIFAGLKSDRKFSIDFERIA